MRIRLLLLFVSLAVCLPAVSAPKPEALRPMTKAQWHSDLAFFARELPKRHANAFHAVTREQFAEAVQQLDSRIEAATDDEIVTGFVRLTALIGDGHTHVSLPPNWHRLAVAIVPFGDEWRVTRTTPANKALLGQRATAIDGVPIADAVKRLRVLAPQDETDALQRSVAANFLLVAEILHGTNIAPDPAKVTLTVTKDDGSELSEVVAAIPAADQMKQEWLSVTPELPLYRRNPEAGFTQTVLPDGKTVYVNWRNYDALAANASKFWQLVDSSKATRVIIDLRQNGGGDYTVGRRHMVEALAKRPGVKAYVIIGSRTFSAAMVNAIDFRNTAHATLVGEPIGEKPNSYQENDEMFLPASRLLVSYSTKLYKFVPDDAPNVVAPDKVIATSWSDFAAGRDPVVDWIVAQN
ncbi:MAG TPA: hypothetical protein VGQ46_20995 [Thermoanaerobaculia bacterium]|jgi:hypothetical protein|nr:hypothetical protein [Thermoanaerobaculia bacterium]